MEKLHQVLEMVLSLSGEMNTKYPLVTKLGAAGAALAGALFLRNRYIAVSRWYRRVPPGLFGVPYFGSLFTVALYGYDFNDYLLPKYGPLCTHNVGSAQNCETITINDVNLVQAMFKHRNFQQRPTYFTQLIRLHNVPMFSISNEENLWRERRKVMLDGIISISKSDFISKQIEDCLDKFFFKQINDSLGAPYHFVQDLEHLMFCVITGSFFGTKGQLEPTSKEYLTFIAGENALIELFPQRAISYIFPMFGLTSILLNESLGVKAKFDKVWQSMYNIFKQLGDDAIDTFIKNDRKIVTIFDSLYAQLEDPNVAHAKNMTPTMLKMDTFNTTLTGLPSTCHTVGYLMLLLAKKQDLQQEIRNELLACCEKSDDQGEQQRFKFVLSRVNNCPKLRAVVHETMRVAATNPRSAPHAVRRTMYVSYDVSKTDGKCVNINLSESGFTNSGEYKYILTPSMIIEPNLSYIMTHDEGLWGPVDRTKEVGMHGFDINRWLERSEKSGDEKLVFKNNSSSMPFGFGLRDCVAKLLALKIVCGIAGNLILNYTLEPTKDKDGKFNKINIESEGMFPKQIKDIPVVLKRI